MSWSDAQKQCRHNYKDLPIIHNYHRQLTQLIPYPRSAWIGLINGASSLDAGQQDNHPRVQDLVNVSACQQLILGNGLMKAVIYSILLSAMEFLLFSWNSSTHIQQRGSMCSVMDRSLFVLLMSGLFWSSSAVSRQYHYINMRMSWPEAQSYCRVKYTDLATVDTMDDVNRLVNIVDAGYSGSVWIGLKRGTQKRWAWSNGENTLTQFSAWNKKEPTSHNECGYFAFGVWYSYPCSSRLHFVCYSESEYIRVLTYKNWKDAQSYCRQHYTDLTTIHNSEEQNKIKSIIPLGSWVWIGLFLDSWEWSDKGSLYFRNWAAGQPSQSSGSGECVGMSTTDSGKWSHESCDLQHPFICYGEGKIIKKQIVRLKLSCNGECTLNDPSLQTAILNEISEKLKSMGLESDSKISWRKEEGKEVFHQESSFK